MARVSVFIASPAEIKKTSIPVSFQAHEIIACYTGIGKLRSAVTAYQHLSASKYDIAINLGTCGSHQLSTGSVVEVGVFVERDVDLTAVGMLPGFFPGAEGKIISPKRYFKNLLSVTCGTGDRVDMTLPTVSCDIYDMESFALAYVCQKVSVPFLSIKFVSDASSVGLVEEWKKNRKLAEEILLGNLDYFLKTCS